VAAAIRIGGEYLRSHGAAAAGHSRLAEYIMRHGGSLEEAEQHARRAIELGGEKPDSILVLADVFVRRKRQNDALTLLERACKAHPDRLDLWRSRAAIEGELGRPMDAAAALKHAVSLRPNDPHIQLDLSSALQRAGNLEEALAVAKAAVMVAGGSPLAERCMRHIEQLKAQLE